MSISGHFLDDNNVSHYSEEGSYLFQEDNPHEGTRKHLHMRDFNDGDNVYMRDEVAW